MRVVMVNLAFGKGVQSPEDFLERTLSLTGCAEGLVQAGAEVVVVQRFGKSARFTLRGVEYHFVGDGFGPMLRFWQIPPALRKVRALQPDAVHFNGLLFAWQAAILRKNLPAHIPILVQHHAEQPTAGWRGWVKSYPLGWVDGFIFTTPELAQPWQHRGFIRAYQPVFGVMEGSSTFTPMNRTDTREITHIQGKPVLLWVGRLDANKDPLTVLSALEEVLVEFPEARLYMAYGPVAPGDTDLLPAVKTKLDSREHLKKAVHLLGTVPHTRLEAIYNSADVFMLGSHREGSGYALVEALACGVVPVVSDIPSFRMMTDQGRLGALWPPGNAAACAEALLQTLRHLCEPDPLQSPQRAFFEQKLSFAAIGRDLLGAYESAIQRANNLRNP